MIGQFLEAERSGQADDPAVTEELERGVTEGDASHKSAMYLKHRSDP